jgi:hypothetical protein
MKACHHSTCLNPVFSNGYCKNHQYLRTDSKYINKVKNKQLRQYYPVKKIVRNINFGFRNESEMFHKIWDERSHICQFTGENLEQFLYRSDGMWFSCFAHILPKGRFPLFKLNSENVRLVYPGFHTIVDQGTKADRLKHPNWDFKLWDDLTYQMKNEYIKFQKDNLLT